MSPKTTPRKFNTLGLPVGKLKVHKYRSPDKVKESPEGVTIFQRIFKPLLNNLILPENQSTIIDGIPMIFCVDEREILWCRALEPFKMPGAMWIDQSHPFHTIEGTGERQVQVDDPLYVRLDTELPGRNEIEFAEQVFILSDAELNFVKEKLEVLA